MSDCRHRPVAPWADLPFTEKGLDFSETERGCEEMRIHFFTAPFYFAFIWFRVQGSGFRVQGSGFKVQGSGFKVQGSGLLWRLRRLFLEMVFSYRSLPL